MNGKKNYDNELNPPPFPNANFIPGRAWIAIVPGGGQKVVSCWPEIANVDGMIQVDVSAEIDAAGAPAGVVQLRLCNGMSVGELIRTVDVPEALADYLMSLPGFRTGAGLCQLRSVGGMAARQLLASAEFEDALRDLFSQIRARHNVQILEVEILVFASSPGGTGAGAALPIADAVAEYFLDRTNAVVNVGLHRLGALTFEGCGSRLGLNTAGTTMEDLAWFTSPRRERLCRTIEVLELPVCGPRQALRDAFAAQCSQARNAVGTREIVSRNMSNWTAGGVYGSINMLRPSFFHGLSVEQLATEVVREFGPEIGRLIAAPADTRQVGNFDVTPRRDDRRLISIDALAETACRSIDGALPSGFVDQCEQAPRYDVSGQITIHDAEHPVSTDGGIEEYLARPPMTGEQYRLRIGLLRAMIERIVGEIEQRQSAGLSLRRRLDLARAELRAAIHRICPPDFRTRLLNMFANPASRLARFRAAASHYRAAAAELARTEAELSLLTGVSDLVEQRLKSLVGKLEAILRAGRSLSTGEINSRPLVIPGELDDIIKALACTWGDHDADSLRRIFATSIRGVTLAGLKEITGAATAAPEDIVARVLRTPAPFQSPWWAGATPVGHGKRLIVFPPVEPSVFRAICSAASAMNASADIVMADTCLGGANVVQLEVRHCTGRHELLTPQILTDWEKVKREPHLYLTGHVAVDAGASDASRVRVA